MFAFIGDLHLGTKLPQKDYIDSLEKFLEIIRKKDEACHCIFVVGDLFEKKLSVDEYKFASAFILNLVCNNCGKNGKRHVPVHFIHGTDSHDNGQYEIFMPMIEQLPDVEVFYTKKACVGNVAGRRVLYLPQEYQDIDYSKFFKDKYDIIVGHGPISSETKSPCKAAGYEILHSAETLGEISKLCVFGHYHGYTDFGNGVYYTGPWLRWKYGEDEERVFFYCDDDLKVMTFKNDIALEFETFHVYSPEELRIAVSKEGIDHPHRFIIHCKDGDLYEYHAIMNAYKKNLFLKYQIISEHRDVDDVVDSESVVSTHSIVAPIPDLIEYVKDKYKEDVTEEVKDYESRIIGDSKPEAGMAESA